MSNSRKEKRRFLRFISTFLAFVMMLTILAPLVSRAADVDNTTDTVTLHKMVLDDASISSDKFPGTTGLDGTVYQGGQIADTAKYFGQNSKEVSGVYFALKFADDYSDSTLRGQYVKKDTDNLTPKKPLEGTNDITQAVGGLTQNQGIEFKTSGLRGKFVIVEDRTKSTYKGDDNNKELTKMKAVPVELTLPIVDKTGVVKVAHVYPKNTENAPTTTKKFNKEFTNKISVENTEIPSISVGDEVPYIINSTISEGSTYKTLQWRDEMSKGLTFNKNVVIKMDGSVFGTENYNIINTQHGFILTLNATGLSKVEAAAKTKEVKFTLEYSATLNSEAQVDVKQPNKVIFDWGNRPTENSTPKSVNPSNGKIKATKTWGEGTVQKEVTFELYKESDGKLINSKTTTTGSVEFDNLSDTEKYYVIEKYVDGTVIPNYSSSTAGDVQIKNEKNPNPKPIEPEPVSVITHGKKFVKTNNEKPGNATKPLVGAEFVVTNNEGKFLTYKSDSQMTDEKNAYEQAEKEYRDELAKVKIDENDTLVYESGASAETIKQKKDARDLAYKKAKLFYEWKEIQATSNEELSNNTVNKLVKLISNDKGQFEVIGLSKGEYTLREIKAPNGYALTSTQEFKFNVDYNTYTSAGDIDYDNANTTDKKDAMQIRNNRISIPMTGGIGSIIVVVAGIAIVAAGVYLKKRTSSIE
ncbi:pilin N-terminal domain-containing protein [Peptostreptococcus equinus]|uniref:Pilin N-terminal domain-containing protein n=1 Tax=Peptostreptococcus equinus TaxID=3003601 RepID=A0ABY7JRR6_9FIRM|nr:pilin N-terminal domain-containing protein [Peptostreptococcus sp. CBA3647]WAW15181.1 pilin N-terminal domain-containing protein [Peptostreptococcus sp. CBA3647]